MDNWFNGGLSERGHVELGEREDRRRGLRREQGTT